MRPVHITPKEGGEPTPLMRPNLGRINAAKRGACTVRAVADKWKAFAKDISGAVDTLMVPAFVGSGPEAPLPTMDPTAQPIVTFTSGLEGSIAKNQQMSLSQANELVRRLDEQFRAMGEEPAPIEARIDYVLDSQTDRYYLPLEIGAGGSLQDQMNRRLEGYRASSAELEQLFDQTAPKFKTELQADFLPVLHDSVNHLYDRLAVYFVRHCEISSLEQTMTQYAQTLPESAQQQFLEFTQATTINLRRKANTDLHRAEMSSWEHTPAQGRTSEQHTTEHPPERRESIKPRLQQHKEGAAQRTTERSHQSQRTAKRSKPAEPGR